MDNIILIETSTELCSTAMASEGKIISYRESDRPRTHASLTAVFIDEMLRETGLKVQDCSAVCVSMGPGSYTGLRVGVSTAKGLCFGAGIPLLAVGTLDTLVWQGITGEYFRNSQGDPDFRYIIPMIDARRMEVYTAVFSPDGKQVTDTEAKIVDGSSFAEQLAAGHVLFIGDAADKCRTVQLAAGHVLFIGDAADKCRTVITNPNAHFIQCCPKASSMLVPAMAEYKEKRFRDVAYFEPFYLKNFVATASRRKLF